MTFIVLLTYHVLVHTQVSKRAKRQSGASELVFIKMDV